MATRAVQVSLDDELLAEVDRDPEAREHGRSAVVRKALRLYLEMKRRRDDDLAYDRAYGGARADEAYDELAPLLDGQAWPSE